MKDPKVEDAQKFLNERYSGQPGYENLEITGRPGSLMSKGLIQPIGLRIFSPLNSIP